MSIFFGLLFARRFFVALLFLFPPVEPGGLFPRINAPKKRHYRLQNR